jgi:hypothetical protein
MGMRGNTSSCSRERRDQGKSELRARLSKRGRPEQETRGLGPTRRLIGALPTRIEPVPRRRRHARVSGLLRNATLNTDRG